MPLDEHRALLNTVGAVEARQQGAHPWEHPNLGEPEASPCDQHRKLVARVRGKEVENSVAERFVHASGLTSNSPFVNGRTSSRVVPMRLL